MSVYGEFASVYDIMQYDVDYDNWIEKITEISKLRNPEAKSMLELACGTGTIGIGLAKKGFNVEALDISEDMLTVAQAKAYDSGVKMKFYSQDMILFNTKKKYDVIFCMCDGLNYILDSSELSEVFSNVSKHLSDKGVFIFDVSSHYKLKEIIGNHTFAETFDEAAYIWENAYDDHSMQLEFSLTLFKLEGETYQKYEEFHTQRAYKTEEVLALTKPYFDKIEVLDGDTFQSVEETSQRICFVMKKL